MIKLSGKDFIETDEVGKLLKRIDSVDKQYVSSAFEELEQFQTFLLSLLLGDHLDLNTSELDEIIKVYLIVWEYFKDKRNIKKRQLTEMQFEEEYLDTERSKEDFINTTSINLENIQSKALIAGILLRFDITPVLSNLKGDLKGIVLIGIKSLIECFEKIVYEPGISR